MNSLEIICLIGIIVVSFIIGRKTKNTKFPIAGEFDFSKEKEKPTIIFNMSPKTMAKFSYVVFKIRGGISPNNERHDV